jgi:hypothetical protein
VNVTVPRTETWPALPYETVRTSPDPARKIREFFQSTYEVGATLGGWDRAALERPDQPPK